jgi:hypothetical protein
MVAVEWFAAWIAPPQEFAVQAVARDPFMKMDPEEVTETAPPYVAAQPTNLFRFKVELEELTPRQPPNPLATFDSQVVAAAWKLALSVIHTAPPFPAEALLLRKDVLERIIEPEDANTPPPSRFATLLVATMF